MRSRRRIRLICRWAGVVILVLWGVSFFEQLAIQVQETLIGITRINGVSLDRGLLSIAHEIAIPWTQNVDPGMPRVVIFPDVSTYLFGDFGHGMIRIAGTNDWYVIVPATVPLGLSAALIGFSFRRRYPNGHCLKCGYDLTGITDKCPECGRAPSPSGRG